MKRPRKYGNTPTVVDGIRFASKKEAKRYGELKLLEKVGEIADLELQPKFPLVVNGVKVCTYIGDFRYRNVRQDQVIVEDAKGVRTDVFIIKSKLTKAVHGVDVVEV